MNMEEERPTIPIPATDTATVTTIEGDPPALTLLPGNDPPTPAAPDPAPCMPGTSPITVDATPMALTATPGQPEPMPQPAESPVVTTGDDHDQPSEASLELPTPTVQTVPIARLQGVQRKLSAAEAALQTAHATIEALNAQVAEANRVAANARIAEITATYADIVPDLITGSTLAEVETSLQTSRRAFAAAQQAYARTIPVSPGTPGSSGNPAQPMAQDQQPRDPVAMISAGLRQPKTDINR